MNNLQVTRKRTKKQLDVDSQIEKALEKLYEEDQNISSRSVLQYVTDLSAPTSITRDPVRKKMLDDYKKKQQETRAWYERAKKSKRYSHASSIAEKDQKIRELEYRVELLTASHKALILAAGEMGGAKGWLRFYEHYQNNIEDLKKMGALPSPSSKIIPFPEE